MLSFISLLAATALFTPVGPVRPFTVDTVMEDLALTHPHATRVNTALPAGVEVHEDIVYRRPNGLELQLDLYRPAGRARLPAVIILHGGGWLSGDRTMERPLAQQLATRGYVAVPVSYRLGKAGRFPAPLHDIKAAVRWLRAHADDYGIDRDHIGVIGGSAGGTLAVLLGATNGISELEGEDGKDADYSSAVQAVVDLDGSVLFASNALIQSSEVRPNHPYWEFVHGPYRTQREVWLAASPLTYTQAQSAPTLFIKSTVTQPILSGREEMCERLRILGVSAEMITYPDTPHPFWLVHPWFEKVVEDSDRFLRQHLLTP